MPQDNLQWISDTFSAHSNLKADSNGYTAMESLQASVGNLDESQPTFVRTGTKLSPRFVVNPKLDWYEEYKQKRQQNLKLLVSTKDNMTFRLYITEMTEYDDPVYQKRFCKFLRTLGDNQTLHIHMGNGSYGDFPIYSYGCMIDAIQRTVGKVVTNINGRASFSETVLWMYGQERVFSEFASITLIGCQKHLEWAPMWRPYLETFYDRAIDIKLINKEEKETLLTTNKPLLLSYRDIMDRLHAKNSEEKDKPQPLD